VVSDQALQGIQDILLTLEREWAEPRQATHEGKSSVLALSVRLERAAMPPTLDITAPPDVLEFWRIFKSARLFEDRQFSQWGLVLVPPDRALELTERFRRIRAPDAVPGDLVVGEFLGDSELLFVRADPKASDHGAVLVALPLDRRPDWYRVAPSLPAFLRQYAHAEGAKFWETHRAQA
jgi:hypothetical protein